MEFKAMIMIVALVLATVCIVGVFSDTDSCYGLSGNACNYCCRKMGLYMRNGDTACICDYQY